MTLLLEMKTCEVEEEGRQNGEIDAQETVCVCIPDWACCELAGRVVR